MKGDGTFRFAMKCMACGLHFNIYSWMSEWTGIHRQPFCPECGKRQVFVLFSEPVKGEIFEYVPGNVPTL